MKTFQSFVRLASQKYKISFEEADQFIRKQLSYFCLSSRTVVCYINWADGDCLTQLQIAKVLKIHRTTVSRELMRLRNIWPHLFGGIRISIPDFLEMQILSKENEHQVIHKF